MTATRDLTHTEADECRRLAEEVEAIDRSADGRPLTPTQERHRSEYIDNIHALLDRTELEGYAKLAADKFRATGDPADAAIAARQIKADGYARQALELRGIPKDPDMTDFDLGGALRNAAEGRPTVVGIDGTQLRALATSADTVPASDFVNQVMVYLRDAAPMWRLATIRDTEHGRGLVIPKRTADPGYGGTVVAEAGLINLADPTLSSNTLTPYKFASMCYLSNELARDGGIDVVQEVARATARELSYDINALFTTGDGSSKPTGWLSSAINGGTAAGTAHPADINMTPWVTTGVGFFGPGDLIDLTFAVATEYRPLASYQVSSATLNVMQNWRDGDGNRLVIGAPDRSSGASAVFNGYAVHVNDDLAAPGSASLSVGFGDWSRYIINRVAPAVRLDISRDFRFQNDQTAVRTIIEADGELVDAASVAYLVSADT